MEMIINDRYNWKGQPERLIYKGKKGLWHQFEKVGEPGIVWCEVLEEDLDKLEKAEEPVLHKLLDKLSVASDDYVVCGGDAKYSEGMDYVIKEIRTFLATEAQGEPVAWATMLGSYAHIEWGNRKPDSGTHTIPLYTAPQPPSYPDNLLSHRRTWIQALERLVELEPSVPFGEVDDKSFWQHELNAMRDMYADIDTKPPADTDKDM